jgi:uncharacterized repeat protein (TIGR03806 family)
VPAGKQITYTTTGTLDFPVGTAIYKTFYYPKATGTDPKLIPVGKSTTHPQGSTIDLTKHRLIETRIIVREASGKWTGTTYVWDADQKDASLNISGKYVEMELISATGAPEPFTYVVPNQQTCQKCHATETGGGGEVLPIGPKVRNMNKDYDYGGGVKANQITHLNDLKLLAGFTGLAGAPSNVDWTDASKPIGDRAKAYLDVNCAHCHNGKGNASQSGLKLTHEDIGSAATSLWGVCKKPLAYSNTAPGYRYDVNPGSPQTSILLFRLNTTLTGDIMTALKLASAGGSLRLGGGLLDGLACTDSNALLAAATALFITATAVSEPAGAFLRGACRPTGRTASAHRRPGFEGLAEFGAGARGDVIQVTAVGGGLFSQRLEQAGLQGQQFLGVLDAQDGLGVGGGFVQGGLGGGHVQFDELFDAFEGLVGQAEQGFDVGFVGGQDLFSGQSISRS